MSADLSLRTQSCDATLVTRRTAESIMRSPVTIWLTGLSGAGKTTLAASLEERLRGGGARVCTLDGDVLRAGLCSDLGFATQDRAENIRRVAHVARLFNRAGVSAVVALISPHHADRETARAIVGERRFIEVFVDAALASCEKRDVKGLYARARRGEIPNFTGLTAPYERPLSPDVEVSSDELSVDACTQKVLEYLDLISERVPSLVSSS